MSRYTDCAIPALIQNCSESLYRLCYPGPHTKFSGMLRSERRLAEDKENKISIHRERVVCQHMEAIRLAQISFQGFSVVNMIIDFVSDWWHLKSVRPFGYSFFYMKGSDGVRQEFKNPE